MSFNRTSTRTSTRVRTLAAAGLLAATALFLTACSPDSPTKTPSAASASNTATEASADASTGAGDEATTDSSAATPGSSDTSTEAPAATPEAGTATIGTDTGTGTGGTKATVDNRVDGTVTGTLTYLAPGKLEVGGRPFYVAVDTAIQGGDICGDPETQVAEKCTADELDAAAKGGNLTVEVTIKKGVAERVAQV
ncbi:hypothetical protein ACFYXF_23735 [Streptomyces sp. NPDC002680]|uniref:hypothetical protein n=1 Tax=Streptomyces sp. NPDC002680 TaxID=3364659 RepID=UPI0036CA9C03